MNYTLKLFSTIVALIFFQFYACAQNNNQLKTIIVDAGHGGDDHGATGDYSHSLRSKEKDITLAISLKLVTILKEKFPDLNIVPTRTTDVFQSVSEKAKIANENKGDLIEALRVSNNFIYIEYYSKYINKTSTGWIDVNDIEHYNY